MHSGEKSSAFDYAGDDDRMNFVRKVYSILACQMAITGMFVSIGMCSESWRIYILYDGWWLWIPCFIISLTC